MPLLYIKLKILDAFLNHNNPFPQIHYKLTNQFKRNKDSKNSMNIKNKYTTTLCERGKQDKLTHPTEWINLFIPFLK